MRVLALGVLLDDGLERGEGLAGVDRRALGQVGAEQRLDGVGRLVEVHQPLDVPGVVDPRMRGVLADEGVGGIGGGLALAGAVICVDQVQARLAGLVGEREARGQALVLLDRRVVVVGLEGLVRLLVQLRRALQQVALVVGSSQPRRAGRGTGRARHCAPDGQEHLEGAFLWHRAV